MASNRASWRVLLASASTATSAATSTLAVDVALVVAASIADMPQLTRMLTCKITEKFCSYDRRQRERKAGRVPHNE